MVRPRIRFILIPNQPLSLTLNTNAAVKKMILFYERILRFLWHTTQINMIWRKIIYREIRRLGKAPDHSFVKDFFGLKYQGNLNNSIEASIYFYGAFEKPLLFFLRDALKAITDDRTVFMDIGANVGQHSLYASKFASKVVAFEPYSEVNAQFKSQVALNKISNIEIFEYGLSDVEETLRYFAPTGHNKGIGSFDESSQFKGNREYGKLQLLKGDDVVRDNNWQLIKLIKIDVEGFEKKVIKGLRATLKKERPILVCEITYGQRLSFSNLEELITFLPPDYELLTFNTRNVDGSKNKRKGSLAKRTGNYELIPLKSWRTNGQDDIVMIPSEQSHAVAKSSKSVTSKKTA